MKKLILALLILGSSSLFAQRTCSTNAKIEQLKAEDPGFASRHKVISRYLKDVKNLQKNNSSQNPNVVTIPVVFHVLYKNQTQNISDAQINSQLAAMNEDFRKCNPDFLDVVPEAFQEFGADMEICFAKATITPSGMPTSGITRKSVPDDFVFDIEYYTPDGEPAWDTSHYLNIWIGRFPPGMLGFGTPPAAAGENYDGLCISYKYFGCNGTALAPFNKGRTVTHELGHYFGLKHTWGDDSTSCGDLQNDDDVADTPPVNDPYFGCPTYPDNSNMCEPTEDGAMFMNFMDYVDDACMAFFTLDQKSLVQATVNGPRASLLGVKETYVNRGISIYPNPADRYFDIKSDLTAVDRVEIYDNNGQLKKTVRIEKGETRVSTESLETGIYYLRLYGQGKFLKSDKLIKK
ncbi:T9SS type A sorting domain-containing protein [Flavobacterium sp.]|uniref:T9SS type A sorting domain-containing protein n=1 Tax=Flavobacterium sp. TaxID=239 RepID=UPI0025BC3101|nr:T9SS type A sorting domain-containing protein [Flavobacterium sp.]